MCRHECTAALYTSCTHATYGRAHGTWLNWAERAGPVASWSPQSCPRSLDRQSPGILIFDSDGIADTAQYRCRNRYLCLRILKNCGRKNPAEYEKKRNSQFPRLGVCLPRVVPHVDPPRGARALRPPSRLALSWGLASPPPAPPVPSATRSSRSHGVSRGSGVRAGADGVRFSRAVYLFI